MANPTPEVLPEEIEGSVALSAPALGSPEPDEHVLAFPGIMRAPSTRASAITEEMKPPPPTRSRGDPDAQLEPDYVIPSVFTATLPTRRRRRRRGGRGSRAWRAEEV